MTKDEALQKIKELSDYVNQIELVEINRVSKFPGFESEDFYINGQFAGNLFAEEQQGQGYKVCDQVGHKANMYLASTEGQWFDETGKVIKGYLYFKPNYSWNQTKR